jgi:AraC-like DNA-binding protein
MLVNLLLAELFTLDNCEVPLRMPASVDLLDLCRTWASRLDLRATAEVWAQSLGISARTLSRRFQQETGLTFDRWRLEYLLRESHARLSLGETVLDVSLALSYDSPTAFCTMFKRRFGVTPGVLRRSAAANPGARPSRSSKVRAGGASGPCSRRAPLLWPDVVQASP